MVKDNAYIKHTLEAIATIEEFTHGLDRKKFLNKKNKLIQDGVMRELQIIGEAVGRLSGEIKKKHPGLPWRDMVGMRNKLVHDYFEVNLNVVWGAVEKDLAVLKSVMQELEKTLE